MGNKKRKDYFELLDIDGKVIETFRYLITAKAMRSEIEKILKEKLEIRRINDK